MRGHKNSNNDLAPEYVREILDYDPITGLLRWKKSLARRIKVGDVAGSSQLKGRIKLGIANKDYMAHRLIWVWMTGKWPASEVDHIDMDCANNRWNNLREATPAQNHQNKKRMSNNTSGYKGVHFDKRRRIWISYIKVAKKRISLGDFNSAEEAYAAYCYAAKKHFGTFARLK